MPSVQKRETTFREEVQLMVWRYNGELETNRLYKLMSRKKCYIVAKFFCTGKKIEFTVPDPDPPEVEH